MRWLALLVLAACGDLAAPPADLELLRIPAHAIDGRAVPVLLPAAGELRFVSVAAAMAPGDTLLLAHPDLPTLTMAGPSVVVTMTVRHAYAEPWRSWFYLALRGTPRLESITLGWCRADRCASLDTWELLP